MLSRKLVVVGLVGLFSFVANIATAEDAVAPSTSSFAVNGIDLADPTLPLADRFQVTVRAGEPARFSNFTPAEPGSRRDSGDRRYELEFIAASGMSGFDVSFAQRGGVGFDPQGNIERRSQGSELRLGRGLRDMPRNQRSSEPTWYLFAASEDEALVWRPGVRNDFGGSGPSFALQDRVEIGDLQAGITYEVNGVQASLAYVEREFSVRNGARSFKQDESFAGLTITMRN